jgi:hypothetical protein
MSKRSLAASLVVIWLLSLSLGCGSSRDTSDDELSLSSDAAGLVEDAGSGDADDGGVIDRPRDAGLVRDAGPSIQPPVMEVLAEDEQFPFNLVIDATHVYWFVGSDSRDQQWSSIRSVSKQGGPVAQFGSIGSDRRPWLAVDEGGTVFFSLAVTDGACEPEEPEESCTPDERVFCLPHRENRFEIGSGFGPLAADDSSVYVRGFAGDDAADTHGLVRFPKDGFGAPRLLAETAPSDGDIVPWGSDVYWATPEAGLIERVSKSGGKRSVLLSDEDMRPERLKVDYQFVYFSDPLHGVFAIPRNGGEPVPLRRRAGITSVDAFGGMVYWTEPWCLGRIRNDGNGGECIDAASANFHSVRVDDTAAYYIRGRDIVRLVMPTGASW